MAEEERPEPEDKYKTTGGAEQLLASAWNWAQGSAKRAKKWEDLTEGDRIVLWRFAAKLAIPLFAIKQTDVDLSLTTAIDENDYTELLSWSAYDIASDMCCYDSQFEGREPAVLERFVQDWLDSRGAKK